MADLNKIIENLSKLTVVEAGELAKQLEKKWGVSAATAVATAPVADGAAAPAEEAPAEAAAEPVIEPVTDKPATEAAAPPEEAAAPEAPATTPSRTAPTRALMPRVPGRLSTAPATYSPAARRKRSAVSGLRFFFLS